MAEEEAARELHLPLAANTNDRAVMLRELVQFATLAPSSHDTQCWKFRMQRRSIAIAPDLSRRCPEVDPDDYHLFVSLGCAAENLAQAARAMGLQANASLDPTGAGDLEMNLDATKARPSPLFQAIPERQCTRGGYDSSPQLRLLEQAGSGTDVHSQHQPKLSPTWLLPSPRCEQLLWGPRHP